jgi:hypothetical protein
VNVVAACGICRPDLHGYADPGLTDLILRPAEPISGRLVLVAGESGIGKTALLDAFQERSGGVRWLWGLAMAC